jgi:hypothetical protein
MKEILWQFYWVGYPWIDPIWPNVQVRLLTLIKNDPPFLIVQGEKDESVPNTQSRVLSAWLTIAGVKNKLIMVQVHHTMVKCSTRSISENVI